MIFIHKNVFENVVCQMAAILYMLKRMNQSKEDL